MNSAPRNPLLPVRLTGRDRHPDRHLRVVPDRRPDGELIAETRSGEGYYVLPCPFDRDPDGTLIARWVQNPSAYMTYRVEGDSRPRLGSL